MMDSRYLEIDKLQYLVMMQNWSLKHVGRPPSWIIKLTFITGSALERYILLHYTKFCGVRSYCCGDITIFHVFQVKGKNSPEDHA